MMKMSKGEKELVIEILSVMRRADKTRVPDLIRDEKDLSEVVKALHQAGFMIVPRGYLMGILNLMKKIFGPTEIVLIKNNTEEKK